MKGDVFYMAVIAFFGVQLINFVQKSSQIAISETSVASADPLTLAFTGVIGFFILKTIYSAI